jgi:hypothetical protein
MSSKEVIDLIKYHQESIEKILEKGFEQFLQDYIKESLENNVKGRQFLYIQMWTPNWNDGEVCSLTSDWCSGDEILEYNYYENNEDVFNGIAKEEIDQSERIDLDFDVMNVVIKVLEHKYETNKQCLVIIDFNNKGNIISIIKDYDCGY